MKIAQVAPLFESVPPKLYGGTERVVYHLTQELVRQGHEVSLFASGDSKVDARLVPGCREALRLGNGYRDSLLLHYLMMEELFRRLDEFDLIHFHIDYLHFPFSRRHPIPTITTMHGRLDNPDLGCLATEYRDMPLVSISNAQRGPVPKANWRGTVYHGYPLDHLPYVAGEGKYLAFLGRISPEKRVDRAIRISIRANRPLKIAAKVDPVDKNYFETVIRPLLDHPLVEFIGEIGDAEKGDFLGNAAALLFPIDWPEPFGLVMIEAMACGTPVVAWRCGSVPEIVEDGKTGFIVESEEEAARAVGNLHAISREGCRREFEHRFTAETMTENYLNIYESIIRSFRFRSKKAKQIPRARGLNLHPSKLSLSGT
jgi:glycosyltransferase involved in cell wall biosynthesis